MRQPLGFNPGPRRPDAQRGPPTSASPLGPHWQLALPAGVRSVHTVYLGVQRHSPAEPSMHAAAAATAAMRQVLDDAGVASVESFDVAAGHDMPGARVQIGSWADPDAAVRDLARLDLRALYASLGDWRHSVGLWMEAFTTRVDRLETCYSGPAPLWRRPGLAGLPNTLAVWTDADEPAPPASATPSALPGHVFDVTFDPTLPGDVPHGYGEHVSGFNLRELMHVRSGYDWTGCGEVEARMGERGLRLLVGLGLDHLWSHPAETGAYGLRQLVRVDAEDRPLADTGSAGFMRSAADVARWKDEQAAHMADFQRLLDQEALPTSERRLRSHQDISALAPGDARFEYVNCGPRTGVIRFLELGRTRLRVRHDLC